jgi:hypothetical protein
MEVQSDRRTNNDVTTFTNAAQATQVSSSPYIPFDTESLLQYCQAKLKQADGGIREAMERLDRVTGSMKSLNALQGLSPTKDLNAQLEGRKKELADLEGRLNAMKPDGSGGYKVWTSQGKQPDKWRPVSKAEHDKVAADCDVKRGEIAGLTASNSEFSTKISEAIQALENLGEHDAANSLRASSTKAMSGAKDDVDAFHDSVKALTSSVGAGREMGMVGLQALVSSRGTMLQMVTNMMNSLNEAKKNITGNIR